jgi:formimidoylglutamate deiminase
MFRFLDRLTPEHVEAIAAFVQMEMLEAGYATNVEFHYLHHQPGGRPYADPAEMAERIAAATARTGIGLTLLPVHYRFGGCDRRPLGPGQVRFGTDPDAFARLHAASAAAIWGLPADTLLGVAPHSLRAVAPEDLPASPRWRLTARSTCTSPNRWRRWPRCWPRWGAARWNGCSTPSIHRRPPHLHPLHPDGAARDRSPRRSGATAGLCPITESSLGDGIFDGVRWLDAGGRIAIGSDSTSASRCRRSFGTLEYSQRLRDRSRAALATPEKSTGRRLHDAILAGGAAAAGRETGAIRPGLWADLLSLDATHIDLDGREGDTILDTFVFAGDDRMVRDVWSAGRHMVREGRHVARDAIAAAYRAALRELRDAL